MSRSAPGHGFGGGICTRLTLGAAPVELAKALATVTDIEDYEYDWALNDAAQR